MKRGVIIIRKKELLYTIIAILLFFQIYLQNKFGFMRFWDEIVTLFCLCKIIITALLGKFQKTHRNMLILIVLSAVIGIISSFYADIQTGIKPIFTDIGNTYKVFITYIGASLYLKPIRDKRNIVRTLSGVIHLFILVAFVCMVLHEVGVIEMGDDVRFGLKSFQFTNDGAGQFSMMFYFVMMILTLELKSYNNTKTKLYIIMALLTWTATLRSRAFMFVLIYTFLYVTLIIKKDNLKLNWKTVPVILVILVFLGMDQIETYFYTTTTARYNLLKYGFYTMKRFFPLGSGFATFGTDAAVEYYSDLYVEYGFNLIHGLSKNNAIFAHDTYWPAIFAQFGFVGALVFSCVVIMWVRDVLRKSKYNRYCHFAGIFLCITQLVSSVATATFFHFVTVGLAFVMPLVFDENGQIERRELLNESSNSFYPHL